MTWLFRARVVTAFGTFTGYGDANPVNVGRAMLTFLPRMAETRSKARALRDATNISVAAMEELGPDGPASDDDEPPAPPPQRTQRYSEPSERSSQPAPTAAPTRSSDGNPP